MKTIKKPKELITLTPFVNDADNEAISPKNLPFYQGDGRCIETDAAYERLNNAETAEEFYNAISVLVFHARHLNPSNHAELARLISKPFKRRRGNPENIELKREADDYAWACQISFFKNSQVDRRLKISELANRHKTSKAVAARAVREAEKKVAAEKSIEKQVL
jgi:hypothetical protein